jgi:hypothetical protein
VDLLGSPKVEETADTPTMLSWPIFSSTVIAARRFSILFIGEVLSW